ncbi:hypothetical protein Acr_00g0082550 [Actinidia rufa]|uniref:Uncharacterized protein n=1 Tax=Actinidia rufa TaxID=165716 RepID=A0A7J0DV07_9ERIC|nr:hypothetical protein Acr_00g0082550 [Actinidia rufa]
MKIENALLDLGTSVNLFPYFVYEKLDLGELKPTSVTLQLADRSIRIPRGVVEDVLIQVEKFYFSVDFVVLDMQLLANLETQIPVILGRPFLYTFDAFIQCRNGIVRLAFGKTTLELNIFNVSKQVGDKGEVHELRGISRSQTFGVIESSPNAIGWTIADINSINPLICTHRIYLEDDVKPSRQPQHRLNSHITNVVQNEVLKLLDIGIVYLIADSKCVSSTQVVPKKSSVTVVRNEKDELIPTRVTMSWRVCIDY